eukprot:7391901-Prymnesium_polylepis.3
MRTSPDFEIAVSLRMAFGERAVPASTARKSDFKWPSSHTLRVVAQQHVDRRPFGLRKWRHQLVQWLGATAANAPCQHDVDPQVDRRQQLHNGKHPIDEVGER